MKKFLTSLVAIFAVILVSGCGNGASKSNTDKLTCTVKEEESGVINEASMEFEFVDNKTSKSKAELKMSFTDELNDEEVKQTLEILKPLMQITIDEFDALDGIEASMQTTDKSLKMVVNIDASKVNEEQLKNVEDDNTTIGISGLNQTKEEVKASIEAEGYTCK